MASFAIGRYVPYNSFLHRLDPRAKLFAVIALMVAVFFDYPSWSMRATMMGALLVFFCFLLYVSRMSLRSILSSLRSLWFMILFLLLIYILVPQGDEPVLGVAWSFNGWTVYWDAFAQAARIMLRLVMMIMLTMILTATTKPLDLTYAIEWYLTPLKIFRFPSAEVAMTISIALRFIPTLLEDANRVSNAQASRGVDFKHGRIGARIVGITSLIIPLFVSSFMRSEDLADAMECRGYDPSAKRTRYRKLRFTFASFLALLIPSLILAGYITVSVMHLDFYALAGLSVL